MSSSDAHEKEQSMPTPMPTRSHPAPVSSVQVPRESRSPSSLGSSPGSESGNDSKSESPRPGVGGRKQSGSIIVHRDGIVEVQDEVFDKDDARAMSPRRNSEDVEKMSRAARQNMEAEAQTLQEKLLVLVDRVESVKTEHDKLEGENRFLQSYIGELMSTSKITASGSGPGKTRR